MFISECLVSEEVQDVFCLCSKGELSKYRVQWLLQELSGAGLTVHHYPFPDGQPPATSQLMKILKELKTILNNQRKPIIQYASQISHFVLDYSFLKSVRHFDWKTRLHVLNFVQESISDQIVWLLKKKSLQWKKIIGFRNFNSYFRNSLLYQCTTFTLPALSKKFLIGHLHLLINVL